MKNKAWKANATLVAVCAGLAGVMCGCGDDTVGGTSGESMVTDASATDAPVDSTTTTPDTGAKPDTGTTVTDATTDSSSETADTGVDTGSTTVVESSTSDTGVVVDSSSTDTGAKDVSVEDVTVADAGDASDGAVETLCAMFNTEYVLPLRADGGVNDDLGGSTSWASEVVTGPASNVLADGGDNTQYGVGDIGLASTGCASDSLMFYLNAEGPYGQNVNHYEQRVFGCVNAPAYQSTDGYAFALVPAEYTNPLSETDLANLVAFYVQQAQLVFQNHGVTLTQSQINEMTELLTPTESLYPQISDAGGSTIPICRDADGGIN